MNAAELERQLWETYLDWNGLLVNPRFCRNANRIAWSRYDIGIIREPITREKILSLVESKQYSFQCAEDGSIFQLLYEFDNDANLVLARLAFYQATLPQRLDEVADAWNTDAASEGAIPWFRFDFTEDYASGVLHHVSHLHISGFQDARFVVAGVPGPRQFTEFVIASCYTDFYKAHRLREDGHFLEPQKLKEMNVPCRNAFEGMIESSIIHIRVPSIFPSS